MLAEVLPWAPDGWIWVYFISSSSVLYVDPDPGRWFVAGSQRRSWWSFSRRGGCKGTATKNGEKTSHRALHTSNPAPASACTMLQRLKAAWKIALWEVWADCETHHTNTTITVHPEWYTIALPGCATCPMNTHQVPWHPTLGSPKFRASAVCELSLFHPCDPHRAVPSLPPSGQAVVWALWPNNNQHIHGFPIHSLPHHLSSTESLAWTGNEKIGSPLWN